MSRLIRQLHQWESALSWRSWQESAGHLSATVPSWNDRLTMVKAEADLWQARLTASAEEWNQIMMAMAPQSRHRWQMAWEAWQNDGVHRSDRVQPWTMTVFLPFAVWEHETVVAIPPDPNPYQANLHMVRHGAEGYNKFVTELVDLLEPCLKGLHQAQAQAGARWGSFSARANLALCGWKLQQRGWLKKPYETWNVIERLERRIGVESYWVKMGVVPIEVMASSLHGLRLALEVLRHDLAHRLSDFNRVYHQVRLPVPRHLVQETCQLAYFEMWAHRIMAVSEFGRGHVNFLMERSESKDTMLDVEAKIILPNTSPGIDHLIMRQLRLNLASQIELEQVQQSWLRCVKPSIVTHWITVNAKAG